MRFVEPTCLRASLLGLLLLGGCESETAELIQEINAAREGCTQEELKAGSEECVQMMERYAEMGTEAIQTYIGAVRSLDQALQRMPPANFDTAGLGHAITPGLVTGGWDDSSQAAQGLVPSAPSYSRHGGAHAYPQGWGGSGYQNGAWYGGDPRYRDVDPYAEPYPRDPYGGRYDPRYAPGYDPRYGPDGYDGYGMGPPQPYYGDRAGTPRDPRTHPRDEGYYGPYQEGGRWRDGRYVDPRPIPPTRGRLLPPEQRLRRPWLENQRPRSSDPRWQSRTEWPDTFADREVGRRLPRRSPDPRYPQ